MKRLAICMLLICFAASAQAADKKARHKHAKTREKAEIIRPVQPFEWGESVADAVRKICAKQAPLASKSMGSKKLDCSAPLNLDVTESESVYVFGPEDNVSLLNYKGIGLQVGTGYQLKYAPEMINSVAYEVTLQFNAVSEGYSAYLYDTQREKFPWMLQKGTRIYLPVVLTSVRLTPLAGSNPADVNAVVDEARRRYRSSFVKELEADKQVYYLNGTWLHVYKDGDMFFDGESYLQDRFKKYDRYYSSER